MVRTCLTQVSNNIGEEKFFHLAIKIKGLVEQDVDGSNKDESEEVQLS